MRKPAKIVFLFVLSMIFFLGATAAAAQEKCPFTDLPNTHWAYDEIQKMVASGVIEGFPDGSFRPSAPVNREQFAAILARSMELKLGTGKQTPLFRDMKKGYWATPYAEAVKDYLIIYETEAGLEFRGEKNASREMVAAALVKAKKLEGEPDIGLLKSSFSDYQNIKKDLRGHIAHALENGLIKGFPDGTFKPGEPLERAQASVLVYRALYDMGLGDMDIANLSPLANSQDKYKGLKELLTGKFSPYIINHGGEAKQFNFTFNVADRAAAGGGSITYIYLNLGMDGDQDQYFNFLPVLASSKGHISEYLEEVVGEAEKTSQLKDIVVAMGFYRTYLFNVSGIFGNDLVTYSTDLNIYEVKQTFASVLYTGGSVIKQYTNDKLTNR
ncbi:MAG TPA: S-layer homology domain-containing protein [Clostridia bacterium]|nr:S-layer homology domain-containing protein [Clostridia bacterium]